MQKVYLFLADGFEEIEALNTIDVLRRGEVDLVTVSIKEVKEVIGAHHVAVVADVLLKDIVSKEGELLIFPGGMPGAKHLGESKDVMDMLNVHYKKGKPIAAICAAPAMVFGQLPLAIDTKLTCYPGFESYLSKFKVIGEGVVVDRKVITAKGPAFAVDFGLAILEYLKGKEKAQEVADGMLYRR